nr:hypothetical protein BaRGS_002091 [Batillaria attramentaria]
MDIVVVVVIIIITFVVFIVIIIIIIVVVVIVVIIIIFVGPQTLPRYDVTCLDRLQICYRLIPDFFFPPRKEMLAGFAEEREKSTIVN